MNEETPIEEYDEAVLQLLEYYTELYGDAKIAG